MGDRKYPLDDKVLVLETTCYDIQALGLNDRLSSKSECVLPMKTSLVTEGIGKGTGDSRVIPCILDRDVAIKRRAVVNIGVDSIHKNVVSDRRNKERKGKLTS